MTPAHRSKTIEAAALGLLFCAALFAPLVYQWTQPALPPTDPVEKRALAKLPKAPKKWKKLANWDRYPQDFEKFYNDHFGFRNELLRGNAWVRWMIFRTSPTTNITRGPTGWYYYNPYGCMDDYRGLVRLSDQQLENWAALIKARQAWLAARGIHYALVFTPNKQSIYPENLPPSITKLRPGTALDQLLAYLRAHSTVPIIDTRETLLAHKATGQIFYRTDTHWNPVGAYYAYQQIVGRMHDVTPELVPKPLPGIRSGFGRTQGDLAEMARYPGDLAEKTDVPINPNRRTVRKSIAFPDGTFTADYALISVDYPNSATPWHAVVLRDSYFENVEPYFSPHFARTVYVWRPMRVGRPQEKQIADVVEQEKPQWFVEEMVERFIAQRVPAAEDVFGGTGAVALPSKTP